ncbi:Pre-rRNA-processing protein TSR2, putative [Perkinsus marinus ATCC 50983]|uniref:Pre-rRNA-processing protein TSR2, putative n=1 Tax=Perkinsus marinus (strain ATCC 50983 / TXsc) TaxID=423536 RepID=C5KH18_PERM5|nr:Pre-rRNA-processing protein TSR2, putative [Perkinsus marinus ATCC 50983]EER15880.1 Pre-rRNA-processing protein TSR2, putative [Perkinsus marinus ATCC 50983]|eukprot:XP_002784084.1 Pre-rRNA-processing protein TSR2, putative [Perkinsus marinus ATCC 50983]
MSSSSSSTECEQAFLDAVHHVFTNWTALTLARDNCDCNPREASQRIENIAESVIADLRAGGAKLSSENSDQVAKLADRLFEMIANSFQMVLEDGSDEDVAYMLIRLWESCSRGDLGVAREVVNATQDRDQSKVLEQCAEEGQGEADNEEEEEEEVPLAEQEGQHKEPEVDEDGFQTVTRGRRRR